MSFFSRDTGRRPPVAQVEQSPQHERRREADAERPKNDSVEKTKEQHLAELKNAADTALTHATELKNAAGDQRQELERIEEMLDNLDPEWRQGSDSHNRESGSEMPGAAAALMKRREEVIGAFTNATSEFSQASSAYDAARWAFIDAGGGKEGKRYAELRSKFDETKAALVEKDSSVANDRFAAFEDYLAQDAEMKAIREGTWEEKPANAWLPEIVEVPDFLHNIGHRKTWGGKSMPDAFFGKQVYETNPKESQRLREMEEWRNASRESGRKRGGDPDAF